MNVEEKPAILPCQQHQFHYDNLTFPIKTLTSMPLLHPPQPCLKISHHPLSSTSQSGMELHFQNPQHGPSSSSSSPSQQPPTKVRGRRANNKSGNSCSKFVGVRQRPSGKWVAEIKNTTQKIRMWLGTFNTAEEAARAYDEAACLLRGSNTRTNFATPHHHPPTNSPLSSKIRNLLLHRKRSSKQYHPPLPLPLPAPAPSTTIPIDNGSNVVTGHHASDVVKQDHHMFDDAYRPDLSGSTGELRVGSSQFDHSWMFPTDSDWVQPTQEGFEFPKHAELLSIATDLEMTGFGHIKVERQMSALSSASSFNAMNGLNEYMENVNDSGDAFWDPTVCQLFSTG